MQERRRSPSFWESFVLAERGPGLRYGVALLLAAFSLALVHLVQTVADRAESSSLALASVVLTAIYGGRGPALLDTALTAIGIDYLFLEPRHVVFDSWTSALHILVHGLVGWLIADIVTSLRNAYRETEAARRAREDILAVVSHDLRSPLSAILLGAGHLKRAAGPQAQASAGSVERAALHMNRLIEDLLDAAKIEKGHFGLQLGEHSLASIVEDAIAGLQSAAQAKGVRFAVSLPAGDRRLRCDRERLRQALANLLGNAVKFSPEGGIVELDARQRGDTLVIDVRDCGPGIPEDELPHVFERYWQGPKTAHLGTGLGLFIAKSIAEAHGGRIEAQSQAGKGCVFTVSLPARAAT